MREEEWRPEFVENSERKSRGEGETVRPRRKSGDSGGSVAAIEYIGRTIADEIKNSSAIVGL